MEIREVSQEMWVTQQGWFKVLNKEWHAESQPHGSALLPAYTGASFILCHPFSLIRCLKVTGWNCLRLNLSELNTTIGMSPLPEITVSGSTFCKWLSIGFCCSQSFRPPNVHLQALWKDGPNDQRMWTVYIRNYMLGHFFFFMLQNALSFPFGPRLERGLQGVKSCLVATERGFRQPWC